MYAKNVTMIEDLPEISDMPDHGGPMNGHGRQFSNSEGNLAHSDRQKLGGKYIRDSYHPPDESGMNGGTAHYAHAHDGVGSPYGVGEHVSRPNLPPEYFEEAPSPMHAHAEAPAPVDPHSCVSVADHTKSCTVCSRLYKNTNIIYLIIIVILVIACAILLNRVLANRS